MTSPAIVLDTETTGKTDPQVIEFARADVTVEPSVNGMLFHLGAATVERYKPSKAIELGALAAGARQLQPRRPDLSSAPAVGRA